MWVAMWATSFVNSWLSFRIGTRGRGNRLNRSAPLIFMADTEAAVVKWMQTGSEHQQSQGRQEAKKRALGLFP